MGNKVTPGFLSDEQKVDHFRGVAGLAADQYGYVSTLKIYEGAEILLYHYNKHSLNLAYELQAHKEFKHNYSYQLGQQSYTRIEIDFIKEIFIA